MFKIETHMHTPYFSVCANVPADELVRRYQAAGYSALTVTDHYNLGSFQHFKVALDSPGNKLQLFLEGYRRVQECAEKEGIQVYYGAELRFFENMNDYLLYGFSDELLSDPRKVCSMSITDFAQMAREDGAIIVQAHPFRAGCIPVDPYYLDGVEVSNRHPGHQNRNDMALDYANRYHLRQTGGSDFHDCNSVCTGGILTKELPKDSKALAVLLRSGEFEIL